MSKAQATLEFTLFFIILAALSLGLIGLWKSSSDKIIRRQINYNATRVQQGSTSPVPASAGNVPYEFTYNNIDAYLNYLSGPAYSLLSLPQINYNLGRINQAISDAQANMPLLVNLRNTWRSFFADSEQQQASAQQRLNDLEAELVEAEQGRLTPQLIGYDGDGGAIYESPEAQINRLNSEIENARNGYYTTVYWDENGREYDTYDSSNAQWMNKFGTRDEWTKDYWVYRQYGVSQGNNVYGLYTNYTPGLLDWQSRKAYAQSQMNNSQSNLDRTESTLARLTAMRDQLLEAQASKSQPS